MKKLWMSGYNLRAHLGDARLKVAIVTAMTIFMVVPSFTAMAQEEREEDFLLEDVVVTGTRIKGVEGVGTSIIKLDREEIEISSSLTLDKIIKELPSIMDLGVTEVTRAQGGGAMNRTVSSSINIHGIGPYSTLTLLDGHRMTNNGKSTEPGVFPTLGVERIEVIADGASAIYGSDAVAGVVNIIPRRSLDGIETSFRIGSASDKDPQWRLGFAAGKIWDSGQFMVAYEHTTRSELFADDRPFATDDQRPYGGPDYRTRQSSPGTIITGGGRSGLPETTYAIPQGGVTQATAASLVPGTVNLFENYYGKHLLPEQEANNMNFTFNQVFDKLEFFADGFYAKRDFTATRGGHPKGDYVVPNTNAFWVQPPGTDPAVVRSYTVALNLSDIPGGSKDYMLGTVKHWQITPGFRYDMPKGFTLEALYSYGESRDFSSYEGAPGRGSSNITDAIASSDPATALDVYGGGRTTPETVAAIFGDYSYSTVDNDFQGYELSVNGPVFNAPGGPVSIAAGYEGQRWEQQNGNIRGGVGATPLVTLNPIQTRDIDSFYAEVYVPLVGSTNAKPGIEKLELTAAWRYDDYSDVGSTTNPRVGFNYSPIEQLRFHGSYGTSFRAPLLENLSASAWSDYIMMQQNYQDPLSPTGITRGYTLRGANPELVPEESENLSFGAAFTPTEDTRIDLTYFSVEYDKQIHSFMSNTSSLLSMESAFAGSGIVLRDPECDARVAELIALGVDFGRGYIGGTPDGASLYVDGRNLNVQGLTNIEGIDFQISHNLRTDNAGSFRFTFDGTLMLAYDVAYGAAGTQLDLLNQINQPLKFKARGAVTWNYEPFTTQLAFRYVNSYDNPGVSPVQKVDSWMPWDILLIFNGDDVDWLGSFGTGFSVMLEARNVFDEDPPYVNYATNMSGGGGWDPSAADPTGRMFGLTLRKNFGF